MSSIDFTTLTELTCPLLEQPTNDMCTGDLVRLLAFNTAVLERMLLNSIVPAGVISHYSGQESDIPPRFLICDGSFYDPQTYPELFDKIRYTYGRDESNGFAVPDLRASIIQGLGLGSECLSDTEADQWEGRNPLAGAVVRGNVQGSRIKHDNTNFYNSTTTPPTTGASIYGKMSLIPVISTGELCGRYEIQSTTTNPCSLSGSNNIGLTMSGTELCLVDTDSGILIDCTELSGLGGNGGVTYDIVETGLSSNTDLILQGSDNTNVTIVENTVTPTYRTRKIGNVLELWAEFPSTSDDDELFTLPVTFSEAPQNFGVQVSMKLAAGGGGAALISITENTIILNRLDSIDNNFDPRFVVYVIGIQN